MLEPTVKGTNYICQNCSFCEAKMTFQHSFLKLQLPMRNCRNEERMENIAQWHILKERNFLSFLKLWIDKFHLPTYGAHIFLFDYAMPNKLNCWLTHTFLQILNIFYSEKTWNFLSAILKCMILSFIYMKLRVGKLIRQRIPSCLILLFLFSFIFLIHWSPTSLP